MPANRTLVNALVQVYAQANRLGLMDIPVVEKIYESAYFFYKKNLEDPYFRLTQKYPQLFRGGHILDIGANIGYTAVIFSEAVEAPYHVFAFEPEPKSFRALEKILAKRALQDRVKPFQLAVGNEAGEVVLWLNQKHRADHRIMSEKFLSSHHGTLPSTRVKMISVDDFVLKQVNPFPISFIKIDVQGYEAAVCQGLQNTIDANSQAVIAFEYSPELEREMGYRESHAIRIFESRAYSFYILNARGSLVKVNSSEIHSHFGRKGYVDIFTSKRELVS